MHRGVAAVWLEPSAQSQAEVQPPAPNMDAADGHQEDVGGEADDEADGQNLLTATPYDGFAKAVAKAVASHTPQHEPPRVRAPEQCVVLPGTWSRGSFGECVLAGCPGADWSQQIWPRPAFLW